MNSTSLNFLCFSPISNGITDVVCMERNSDSINGIAPSETGAINGWVDDRDLYESGVVDSLSYK